MAQIDEWSGRILSTIRTDLLRDAMAITAITTQAEIAEVDFDPDRLENLELAVRRMREAAVAITTAIARPGDAKPGSL